MRRALQIADDVAKAGEVPVGAVIVCDGVEVASAGNTRERDRDPCGHAELNAIRAAAASRRDWRLDGCTVYVTLEPCAMCAGAMVLARIARCVYGTADPKGGFCGTLGDLSSWPGLNHRFAVTGGVLGDEASEQLKAFFAGLRLRKGS